MLKKEYPTERSNLLTEMRAHSMTLQELRFLSIYLSKINPLDINSRYVEFSLDEFQKIMELGRIDKNHIKEVFTRLLCKVVEIPINTGRRKGFSMVTLFNKCQCFWDDNREETLIIIDAHDDTLPLLFDLQNNFLKYQLWNCLRLKSVNQIRMYEILKQYETTKDKSRTLSIEDLKDMLGIDKKEYPVWQDFKTKVIEVCKKALKENTDIYFEYEPIKKGRKFVEIKFLIYKNKDYKDPLQLDEFIQTNKDVIEVDCVNITSSAMGDVECEPEITSEQNNILTEHAPEPTNEVQEQPFIYDIDNDNNYYEYLPKPPPEPEEIENSIYDYDFWNEDNYTNYSSQSVEPEEHKFKESFLDEFNQDEVNAFYQLIKFKSMSEEQNNFFIQTQYNNLLVANSKNKIKSSFKYLSKIISTEIEKYTPPIAPKKPSYDLEEIDEMYNNFVPNLGSNTDEFCNVPMVKFWSDDVQDTIRKFIKYREDMRKPFTDDGLFYFVEELKNYNDNDKVKMMKSAIRGGYTDVVPPKQNNEYQSNNNTITDEELKALEEEFNY